MSSPEEEQPATYAFWSVFMICIGAVFMIVAAWTHGATSSSFGWTGAVLWIVAVAFAIAQEESGGKK